MILVLHLVLAVAGMSIYTAIKKIKTEPDAGGLKKADEPETTTGDASGATVLDEELQKMYDELEPTEPFQSQN